MDKEKSQLRKSDRKRRRSRSAQRGKYVQIRKGLGACIFTLGIPLVIAGSILLIVASRADHTQDVPAAFLVLGPVLIAVSVVFFAVGSIMTELINVTPCLRYCVPDDPKNFCWKRCPRLFSLLRPNDVTLLNRRDAGLHALQSVPSKPMLKKQTDFPHTPSNKRGVRFSDSDAEVGCRSVSISSEPPDLTKGDNSPSASLLSLRHCKIYPKEERWGSVTSDPGVLDEGEEEEESGEVFTLSGSVDQDVPVTNTDGEHVTYLDQSSDL